MSYKKVQQLADKFVKTGAEVEYYSFPEKPYHFASDFLRNVRAALNEIEGDLMTLKYRDFNRNQWKELGNLWKHGIDIYKSFDENKPEEGVKEFADLLLEKKDWITKIMPAIQQHLKNTEVDFIPGPRLIQARADGLKELIRVVNEGVQYIEKNTAPSQLKTLKPPAPKRPSSTFISAPVSNSNEQIEAVIPKSKREAL